MNTTTETTSRPTRRRATAAQGPWLTPTGAAEYLGVGRTQIYALMNKHDLPYFEVEGMRGRKIRPADLDRLLRRAR